MEAAVCFLWFSEQEVHFSGSDQALENMWLKVSIPFIFSFYYSNHLDKNKILTFLLLSSC